jgi:putative glutathione S-transferase
MFNSAFDAITGNTDDYWPVEMREGIEGERGFMADEQLGVYKSGFATTQAAYDAADLHRMLFVPARLVVLGEDRYQWATKMTEADWRLWTLLRFVRPTITISNAYCTTAS